MNSFIPWIGGKKLLRKTILSEFPANKNIQRYVEVFGGAGWVLFGKEQIPGQLEVYNDIDHHLINLYRCIKYHCDELQRELDGYVVSREQFFDCREQLDARGLTDIQRAARYYILIRTSFGADRRSFGVAARNLKGSIAYLPEIKERLQSVVIEQKDCAQLITTYDRPDTLFYLDPPYLGTEKLYDAPFGEADHRRLCECLKQIKGRFILSYNAKPFLLEMYKEYRIISVERSNNLLSKPDMPKYQEIIVKNY